MKRIVVTFISCFALLSATIRTPALAEIKNTAGERAAGALSGANDTSDTSAMGDTTATGDTSTTSALKDVLTKTSDVIQDVLTGVTTNVEELLRSSDLLLSADVQSAPVTEQAASQDSDTAWAAPPDIPGVVWGPDHETCTIQSGYRIDAAALAEATALWKYHMKTFTAEDNTGLTGDASNLFWGCIALRTLNLSSSFDVSAVSNMSQMFRGCTKLTSITLPDSFAPTSATSMSHMFEECYGLTSLSLGNGFAPTAATDLSSMFAHCGLSSLRLPNAFAPTAATNLSYMFYESGLTSLSLGEGFTPTAATNMSYMFCGCANLTSFAFPAAFVPSAAINMSYMFSGCSKLASITFPATFAPMATQDMSYMFWHCSELASITFPNAFVPSAVKTFSSMFEGCTSLASVTFPPTFAPTAANTMTAMFFNCSKLTALTFPNTFAPTNVYDMRAMFQGCSKLATLRLPSTFAPSAIQNISFMFYGCSELTSITLPDGFAPTSSTNMVDMFEGCSKLTSITLPESFGTGATLSNDMFAVAEPGSTALSLRSITLPKGFRMMPWSGLPGLMSQGDYKIYWTTSISSCVNYGVDEIEAAANINKALAASTANRVTFTNVNVALGFNANGGTYPTTDEVQGASTNEDEVEHLFGNTNTSIEASDIPAPKLAGHKLVGWSTTPDGEDIDTPSAFPASDATYYAKYATAVAITYDANGHGIFSDDKGTLDIDCIPGQKLTLPGADDFTSAEGYVLLGWFTAASGGSEVPIRLIAPRLIPPTTPTTILSSPLRRQEVLGKAAPRA